MYSIEFYYIRLPMRRTQHHSQRRIASHGDVLVRLLRFSLVSSSSYGALSAPSVPLFTAASHPEKTWKCECMLINASIVQAEDFEETTSRLKETKCYELRVSVKLYGKLIFIHKQITFQPNPFSLYKSFSFFRLLFEKRQT